MPEDVIASLDMDGTLRSMLLCTIESQHVLPLVYGSDAVAGTTSANVYGLYGNRATSGDALAQRRRPWCNSLVANCLRCADACANVGINGTDNLSNGSAWKVLSWNYAANNVVSAIHGRDLV